MVTHELQICRLQNNELDFTKYNSPFGTRVFKNINANPAQNYFLLCLFFQITQRETVIVQHCKKNELKYRQKFGIMSSLNFCTVYIIIHARKISPNFFVKNDNNNRQPSQNIYNHLVCHQSHVSHTFATRLFFLLIITFN